MRLCVGLFLPLKFIVYSFGNCFVGVLMLVIATWPLVTLGYSCFKALLNFFLASGMFSALTLIWKFHGIVK